MKINKVYNMDFREWLKQLDENSVDLIVFSPPYNAGIDYYIPEISKPKGL